MLMIIRKLCLERPHNVNFGVFGVSVEHLIVKMHRTRNISAGKRALAFGSLQNLFPEDGKLSFVLKMAN
jgi:hypothetical protein